MSNPNDDSEISALIKVSEGEVTQVKQLVKAMKRRLPQQETRADGIVVSKEFSIAYPASECQKMNEAVKELLALVRAHYVFGRSAAQQAGLSSDPEAGLPPVKASELMHSAIDRYHILMLRILIARLFFTTDAEEFLTYSWSLPGIHSYVSLPKILD